jgi:hypothetical protein
MKLVKFYEERRLGRDSLLVSIRGPTTPRARMTHADADSTGPCAMLSRGLTCTRQARGLLGMLEAFDRYSYMSATAARPADSTSR